MPGLVCLSDTRGQHGRLTGPLAIPDGDVLVVASGLGASSKRSLARPDFPMLFPPTPGRRGRFRHAHASHALDRGAPPHLVQQTLGHVSLQATGRYTYAPSDGPSARYLGV